jgi:hypothetical protein
VLYAARGRYYEMYTKQHGVETNLFLAPGEGDDKPSQPDGDGEKESDTPALAEAVSLIRRPAG